MNKIEVEDGLRIRFPGREDLFCEGVEVGLIIGLLASLTPEFDRLIESSTVEQAAALAVKFGYRICALVPTANAKVRVTFTNRPKRPQLRIVRFASTSHPVRSGSWRLSEGHTDVGHIYNGGQASLAKAADSSIAVNGTVPLRWA